MPRDGSNLFFRARNAMKFKAGNHFGDLEGCTLLSSLHPSKVKHRTYLEPLPCRQDFSS
jgi:hypothetical protein